MRLKVTTQADVHPLTEWFVHTERLPQMGEYLLSSNNVKFKVSQVLHKEGAILFEVTPWFDGRTPANFDPDTGLNILPRGERKGSHVCTDNLEIVPDKFFKGLSVTRCKICKSTGGENGHHCESSPDGSCHYFTGDDGLIFLHNGTKAHVPDQDNCDCSKSLETYISCCKPYETYDGCLFCGQPEERK